MSRITSTTLSTLQKCEELLSYLGMNGRIYPAEFNQMRKNLTLDYRTVTQEINEAHTRLDRTELWTTIRCK